MTIHVLNIRDANGVLMRILAARENTRALLADFDVCVIQQIPGKRAAMVGRDVLRNFPRALGVDGLFARVLTDLSEQSSPALNELGQPVPFPELSPEEWKAIGRDHLRLAGEAFRCGGVLGPEFVEEASR